ncbi:cytochrome c biogenesis protein [Phormidium tenue]|uniref:Cytochrome c biogenesis protein CcsB n=1 Tax=Phormidium tenue NIES-30 TaxID=549789 RepID=A0A1U7JAP9_9CYAN|nr:cytochrome c biogenesis protein [Phormidium tenue]MBD2230359.1 cytochrome c biogenesis protein [Phormidium tenue FACHB-1052]OKH50841.1 cytochrome C biogenesis protein CcsB [Phormidium tenue NIES-30]
MAPSEAPQPTLWDGVRDYFRQDLLPLLADLRLAIVLLLAIAAFSISGTVIEQGQTLEFYQTNYPQDPALFGFLSWKVILTLGLDHVYRTWWFLALLIVFGASLTACTFTRQFPALGAAQKWKYYTQPRQFQKLALSAELSETNLDSLSRGLAQRRYRVFQDGNQLYGRKGIVGRIGPIVVHASMLLILAGAILGAMTGFFAQEIVPSGETFQIRNIFDAGPWAEAQIPKDWSVRVNRFWIDYTPEGNIDQFYSDLSVLDRAGDEVDRKTIFVNQPLRHKGVTLYQADWGVAAVQVKLNNSPVLQLPMQQLENDGPRFWGTWLPTKPDMSEGVTLLASDLQGSVLIYDNAGQLISTVRKGMAAEVNGVRLSLVDVVGSTGLQIKADPGIPLVYGGFGLLMLGVIMSYVSHSQVWALAQGGTVYVGGRTNRAQVAFERELLALLEAVSVKANRAELAEAPVS